MLLELLKYFGLLSCVKHLSSEENKPVIDENTRDAKIGALVFVFLKVPPRSAPVNSLLIIAA